MSNVARPEKERRTHHVKCLKDLTLVARAVTVEGKRGGLFPKVLLGKGEACADGDLCTNDAITAKEGRGKDVHGTALSLGHATLAAEEFSNDALDGAAAHDCKGMTAVGGDDTVFGGNAILETD